MRDFAGITLASSSPNVLIVTPSVPATSVKELIYESVSMVAAFVPAKTPPKIAHRLNQEIVAALKKLEARDRLFKIGIEVVASTPQELAKVMKSDMVRMGKVIKDARIHEPK